MKILVLNGPNLNMLGTRKREIYGTETLADINEWLKERFPETELEFYQTNHEGDIIDKLQTTDADGVVLNAGAYTHYSIAIRDAIEGRESLPCVEVHLSDISKREDFRKVSFLTEVCKATFAGFGKESYAKGIEFLLERQNG